MLGALRWMLGALRWMLGALRWIFGRSILGASWVRTGSEARMFGVDRSILLEGSCIRTCGAAGRSKRGASELEGVLMRMSERDGTVGVAMRLGVCRIEVAGDCTVRGALRSGERSGPEVITRGRRMSLSLLSVLSGAETLAGPERTGVRLSVEALLRMPGEVTLLRSGVLLAGVSTRTVLLSVLLLSALLPRTLGVVMRSRSGVVIEGGPLRTGVRVTSEEPEERAPGSTRGVVPRTLLRES